MGLGNSDLELLIRLRRQGELPSGGWVAEIGAQQLSDAFLRERGQIEELGALFGKKGGYDAPKPIRETAARAGLELQDSEAPPARPFWEWLGYQYLAIDVDGSPGAIALDLNYDDIPMSMAGRCSLVTNYGTTEHVANQLQAFKVIHDLTAVGGVMIHNLPAQGFFNHGLVNYNPKFFWRLARSNNYSFLFMDMPHHPDLEGFPENILGFIGRWDAGKRERAGTYRGSNAGIIVALKKDQDIGFIPPVDIPDSAFAAHPGLRHRYWTATDFSPMPSWLVRSTRRLLYLGRKFVRRL